MHQNAVGLKTVRGFRGKQRTRLSGAKLQPELQMCYSVSRWLQREDVVNSVVKTDNFPPKQSNCHGMNTERM